MATAEQRARRRAQRETAKAVKEHRRQLPSGIRERVREAMFNYGHRVLAGEESRPEKGTPEAKQLARLASLARWNKADPEFEAFEEYFYKNKE